MFNNRPKINPKCIKLQRIDAPFVELDGTFLPCCWLSTDSKRIDVLKKFYGDDYNELKLQKNSVQDILKIWEKIAQSWYTEKPLETCQLVCGEKQDV
jgi:hypothetical protein